MDWGESEGCSSRDDTEIVSKGTKRKENVYKQPTGFLAGVFYGLAESAC